MIGLFAFFYGTLHFMIYFILDRSLMFDGLWEDIVKRPYITVGFTGVRADDSAGADVDARDGFDGWAASAGTCCTSWSTSPRSSR